jgi:hypothetical protein
MANEAIPVLRRRRCYHPATTAVAVPLRTVRFRRRGVLPTGLSPGSFFVAPKRRTVRRVTAVPVPTGKRRRGKLPNTGQPPLVSAFKRRGLRPAGETQLAIQRPRPKRRRVPGAGQETLRLVRRKRFSPRAGQLTAPRVARRRRRLPFLAQTPGPVTQLEGRPRQRPAPAPPTRRQSRRRVPGAGITPGPVVLLRKRTRKPGQVPAARGFRRRGKLIGLGLAAQVFRVLKRRRTRPAVMAWAPRPRRRRFGPLLTLVGSVVAGPYWWAAGQIYCPGAAAGDLRSP